MKTTQTIPILSRGVFDTAAELLQASSQRMSDGPETQLLEVWRSAKGASRCICMSAIWPLIF